MTLKRALSDCPVSLELASDTKKEVILELIDLLNQTGKLSNREAALSAVLEREKKMSTGMQHGIAIPHGKTDTVDQVVAAVGLKPTGIDFDSIVKQPATIFILTISPKDRSGPHIRFLAEISRLLDDQEIREQILEATSEEKILQILAE